MEETNFLSWVMDMWLNIPFAGRENQADQGIQVIWPKDFLTAHSKDIEFTKIWTKASVVFLLLSSGFPGAPQDKDTLNTHKTDSNPTAML